MTLKVSDRLFLLFIMFVLLAGLGEKEMWSHITYSLLAFMFLFGSLKVSKE